MKNSNSLRRLARGLALVGQDISYEATAMVSTVPDNSFPVSGTGATTIAIPLDGP